MTDCLQARYSITRQSVGLIISNMFKVQLERGRFDVTDITLIFLLAGEFYTRKN